MSLIGLYVPCMKLGIRKEIECEITDVNGRVSVRRYCDMHGQGKKK